MTNGPKLALFVALVVLVMGIAIPASAAGGSDKRTCGLLPGDGAFSYVQTRNVSCRVARKVSTAAGRKFCGRYYQHCNRPPEGGKDRGRVKVKGWRCKMKVGYEFYRARCARKNQGFVYRSGA